MARTTERRHIFAGDEVRALRRRLGQSQATLARTLGLSTSYLSQIESGDRPITGSVLAVLSRSFPLEWPDVTPQDSSALIVAALAAGSDPLVPAALLDESTLLRSVKQQPLVARRLVALHAALRRSQEQLRVLDDRIETGSSDGSLLPWEEVRDWFQGSENYVDPLDQLAEATAATLPQDEVPLAALSARLRGAHAVTIEAAAADGDAGAHPPRLRAYDDVGRVLLIDRSQPVETQSFQMAHQLIRLEAREVIDRIVAEAPLRSDAARELLRVGLANYGAGALLMPYGRFRIQARNCRHDVDRLRQSFGVSFEQACHRLSTLQRPSQKGTPFFFCRIDMAGNITKRHSATRLQFAQFGGTCPLWIVHEAVAIPDRIVVQLAQMPDGVRYVSMAKGLVKASASYRRMPRRYAVALGCEIEHGSDFVYADGLDRTNPNAATPIGSSCRICPRKDCDQRAFPPAGRDLIVDRSHRGIVPYSFE